MEGPEKWMWGCVVPAMLVALAIGFVGVFVLTPVVALFGSESAKTAINWMEWLGMLIVVILLVAIIRRV